jgi:hypothetical protein
MAAGSYNTMVEWLNKINADLAQAMTCPDADLQFLTQLQTSVLQKLRSPYDANPNGPAPQLPPGGGPGGPGGGPPPDMAALLGAGGTPIPPAGPPPMPPGNGPMPAAPRPGPTDMGEIARMIGG